MVKSKIKGDMICPFCIENGEHYRVSANTRSIADDLMRLHIKKRHMEKKNGNL